MAKGLDLSIEVIVPPALQHLETRGAAIAGEELFKATEWGTQRILQTVQPLTPVGVGGTLRGANQSLIGQDGIHLVTGRVFNPLGYALPVETGGRPHWAPLGPILLWTRRKLGEGAEVARAIQIAIARRGTKASRMYQTTWARVEDSIRVRYDRALTRIVERLKSGS